MKTWLRFSTVVLALVLTVFACVPARTAVAAPLSAPTTLNYLYNKNLIDNPGAEAATDGIPHSWTVAQGTPLSRAYGHSGSVAASDPGPIDRGRLYFYGGTAAVTAIRQVRDIRSLRADTNAGAVRLMLSGWLGGWLDQPDNAVLAVTFLGQNNTKLGPEVKIGPVTPAQRGSKTGLMFVTTSALVPAGANTLRTTLTMTRVMGGDNDGVADNLSLMLTPARAPKVTINGIGIYQRVHGAWAATKTVRMGLTARFTAVYTAENLGKLRARGATITFYRNGRYLSSWRMTRTVFNATPQYDFEGAFSPTAAGRREAVVTITLSNGKAFTAQTSFMLVPKSGSAELSRPQADQV